MSTTPRIRIKRGFGPPIEDNEVLLSRGELAFDESSNFLYVGKGLADQPVSGNPSQANEVVVINKPKYLTKTIETPQEGQNVILILGTKEGFDLSSVSFHLMSGSCEFALYSGNFTTNDVLVDDISGFIEEGDLLTFDSVSFQFNENSILYLSISNVSTNTTDLTIQITYS
jgi:hypothetical protein